MTDREFFTIVTRIDFDSMENHTPRVRSLAIVFTGATTAESAEKAAAWIAAQEHGTREGWDRQRYPQYSTESGEVGTTIGGTMGYYT